MKYQDKVTKSSQVDVFLPNHIQETYKTFVDFMTSVSEADERVGFSQDLLQNLLDYRDFDTYQNGIVKSNRLKTELEILDDEIILEDGFGFPENDGIVYIDDEIILYRKRTENILTGLQRGVSGTIKLSTFQQPGITKNTSVNFHDKGAVVQNLSVLFLSAMLQTIHETFTPGIPSDRVSNELNRSSILQNIKDFFQSKGTELGIKSLFKILFTENDVRVDYPGDRMIVPSDSSFAERFLMRVVPIPDSISGIPVKNKIVTPDKITNQILSFRSFNDTNLYGRVFCEYAIKYPYSTEVTYELWLSENSIEGDFLSTPRTKLTREVQSEPGNFGIDNTTITVESTVGFPDSGFLFIGSEMISYESKTFNQFLNCKRSVLGIERQHDIDDIVSGPYYVEASYEIDGVTYTNRNWVLGLVDDIDIRHPGLLHTLEDDIVVEKPGRIDDRDVALRTIRENLDDNLATQTETVNLPFIGNLTYGVSGVYFDSKNIFVTSTNWPNYPIGPFTTDPNVKFVFDQRDYVHIIPRKESQQPNDKFQYKGNGNIGMFVDGVPALSNEAPLIVTQGKIANYDVKNSGSGYNNPTVVIDPPNCSAKAIVDDGKIIEVVTTNPGLFVENPNINISSGEGAAFTIETDKFGRVIKVNIISKGRYYNDAPSLSITDFSGKGRGALLRSEVLDGGVENVIIEHPGIDYNPQESRVTAQPIGSGAEVEATVEYFTLDRYKQIQDSSELSLDKGNGFVSVNDDGERSNFAYLCSPNILRQELDDTDDNKHSPVIGWAYDGNPIYGPYGYKNSIDDKEGFTRMTSGYILRGNRSNILPRGYSKGKQEPAYSPPSVDQYPMGTFIEDYYYNDGLIIDENLDTEDSIDVLTEKSENIIVSVRENSLSDNTILDENNGRICNTPEYPRELYPDGVYCYFITVDFKNEPIFPYILGKTFENHPISQNLSIQNNDPVVPITRNLEYQTTTYESPDLDFNFDKVERHRNDNLISSSDDIDLEIGNVTYGGVHHVEIQDAGPDVSTFGDNLYFENTSDLGDGVVAIVSKINGKEIISGEGVQIATRLISHTIQIDLSPNKNSSYVFVKDTFVRFTSGSTGRVESYNTKSKILVVVIETPELPISTDCFKDNRGTLICLTGEIRGEKLIGLNTESTFIGEEAPDESTNNIVITQFDEPRNRPDGSAFKEGDLWWSPTSGRLYIYYKSDLSFAWINTQPIGMRPFNGALDIGLGIDEVTSNNVYHEAVDNTITISLTSPSSRPDGKPNVMGDLWFSPQTGILYLWHSDILQYALEYYTTNGELPTQLPNDLTMEWVCTDPAAMKPYGNTSLDQLYPDPAAFQALTFAGSIYSANINCMISEKAPQLMDDGTPISIGALWWCSSNGKMFVYYDDGNSVQWVITNPYGSLTSSATPIDDNITGPDGGGEGGNGGEDIGGGATIMPEPPEREILWFQDLTHFLPDDFIEFDLLSPSMTNEQGQIRQLLEPHSANVRRGTNGVKKFLPHDTPTYNLSRTLYTVHTDEAHNLKVGDVVEISGSIYDEVNGPQVIIEVGDITPAVLEANIDVFTGQISSIDIIDPGQGYEGNFYLFFSGGNGYGASAYAIVSPGFGSIGGSITDVVILNPGENYTSPPEIIVGGVTNKMFSFYLKNEYPTETNLSYVVSQSSINGSVAEIKVLSPGLNYYTLPKVTGIVKRFSDNPRFTVDKDYLNGIEKVDVINYGDRLINPRIIIEDETGKGEGAVLKLNMKDNIVLSVDVLEKGKNYESPAILVIDDIGKFVPTTKDIGQITSLRIINPGRNISSDRSYKPEIQIETRFVVKFADSSINTFTPGQIVYQGIPDDKYSTGTVVDYDDDNQILLLEKIDGRILEGEKIYNEMGTVATVINSGQSDIAVIVDATSKTEGQFLTEKSMVSSSYAVIQDSFYYQHFSYLISSTLQESFFKEYVKNIIHPAGFIMFTEVTINTEVVTPIKIDSLLTETIITIS